MKTTAISIFSQQLMKILNICNKLIEYSFYALFFLVPLVFAPNTSELFELNKMWITFGITIIITFAWSIKMIIERKIQIQRTPFDIFLLLFLLSQFISSLISLDQRISFWGYYSRFNGGFFSTLCYVILYYAFASNLTIKHTYKMLITSLISGVFVALWGFPSHFGKDPTCKLIRDEFDVSCWTDQFHPMVRIFSTLGQPAWMASYMAVILCIFIGLALGYIHGLLTKQQEKNSLTAPFPWYKNITNFSAFSYITSAAFFTLYLNIYLWQNNYGSTTILIIDSILIASYLFVSFKFHKKTFIPLFISCANILVFFYLCLIYANTRAGYLAFWIAVFVFVGSVLVHYFLQGVKKSNLNSTKPIILSIAMILILLAVSFFTTSPFAQLQRFTYSALISSLSEESKPAEVVKTPEETNKQPAGTVLESGGTESGNIRRIVWKGAIDAWKNNPLFGTGVETFAFAYYKYRPVEHNLTSEWDYLYNKAHNEYLNYLTTTGLFGLGTYLAFISWFMFLTIKWLLQHKNNHPDNQTVMLVAALLAGFISILIANFFGFSVVITNLYLFLIPLFVLHLTDTISSTKLFVRNLGDDRKETYLSPYQWTGIVIIGSVSFFMLVSLMRFWHADTKYALGNNLDNVGQYVMANPLLTQAVQTRPSEQVFTDELAVNNASLAIDLLKQNPEANAANASQMAELALSLTEQATIAHPNNLLVWKNRVRVLYILAQANPDFYQQALSAMLTSQKLAPTDAKISYNLGVLYGQIGQLDKGIATLKETIQLKPNYRDAYFALGLFYHESSLKDEKIANPEMHQQAVETMNFILKNLNPNDKQIQDTLESWEELQ